MTTKEKVLVILNRNRMDTGFGNGVDDILLTDIMYVYGAIDEFENMMEEWEEEFNINLEFDKEDLGEMTVNQVIKTIQTAI